MNCTRSSLARALILKAIAPCAEERSGQVRLALGLAVPVPRVHNMALVGTRTQSCYVYVLNGLINKFKILYEESVLLLIIKAKVTTIF